MAASLKLTIVSDNCVASTTVLAEHGLSMVLELGGRRIIFDTGQGRVLEANLSALEIAPGPAAALVLSHGHFDHTGGLPAALAFAPPESVFLHPYALARKFTRLGAGPVRSIGMPDSSIQALDQFRERIVWARDVTEVAPGLWSTGEIPRKHPSDPCAQPFFLDGAGREADPLLDDQALFAETRNGLVVITGCAHAGVENTIAYVLDRTGRRSIHALIGGFHLGQASEAYMNRTATALERAGCRVLAPCHCTGMKAMAFLRNRFPSEVQDAGAGTRFLFE